MSYTTADLDAEDRHIRAGESFVLNQQQLISDHSRSGLSTAADEAWLAVFQDGLVRHRVRRAEILEALRAQLP